MRWNSIFNYLFIIMVFFVSVSFAYAHHDPSVDLQPEWSPADQALDYNVNMCNNLDNGGETVHPVDEIRIYQNPAYTNFSCEPKQGWNLEILEGFPDSELGNVDMCWYYANSSNTIGDGECANFSFGAQVPDEGCNFTWKFETRDEHFTQGTYKSTYDSTSVDDQKPVIEKTLGEPFIEKNGEKWISQGTPVNIHAYDESLCTPPSGIEYCEYRYDVDGGEQQDWTKIDWDSSIMRDGLMHYFYTFQYEEDSVHDLEVRCVDKAGNEVKHAQTEKVDSANPDTIKRYTGPNKIKNGMEWIDSATNVHLEPNDTHPTGEGCDSGVSETWYKTGLAEQNACQSPAYCTYENESVKECSGWDCVEEMEKDFGITGRYGNNKAESGDWELAIKEGDQDTPEVQEGFIFPNEQMINFMVSYNPEDGKVTYTVGDKTLEWTYDEEKAFEYVVIAAKGDGNSETELSDLHINGESLSNIQSGDDIEGLQTPLTDPEQADGFVVKGKAELNWDESHSDDERPGFHVFAMNTHDLLDGWSKYDEAIKGINESCHSLKYFSTDEIGNVEEMNKDCFFVDKTAPNVSKETTNPKMPLNEEGLEGENNWWVTPETDIIFNCEDEGPHPSGDEQLCFKVSYDMADDGYVTEEYCNKYNGEINDGVCCVDASESFKFNFNTDEDSMHSLEYYCRDAVNKTSETHVQNYRVDSTAPSINKSMLGEEGQDWAGDCPPDSADDECYAADNGIGGVHVDVEDGSENCAVGNLSCNYTLEWKGETIDEGSFSEEGVDIKFTEDSTHTLTINCHDGLGNNMVEDVEKFLVDSRPPESMKEYGEPFGENQGEHYITSSTPINLSATDNKIGVDKLYYRYCMSDCYQDEGQSCECSGEWNVVDGNKTTFTIPEDSEHCIQYFAQDKFGQNETVNSQCVYVDNQAPVGNKTVGEPKLTCTVDSMSEPGTKDSTKTQEMVFAAESGNQQPQKPEEREADVYQGSPGINTLSSDICDSASAPDQCAYVEADMLPPYAVDTIEAEGGNVTGCGKILVLSSGDPLDNDTSLSTGMGNPGCGTNPDGFATNDCVILENVSMNETSVVLAASSEWPEYLGSEFTDWMQVSNGASTNISIEDWGTANTIPYGPDSTGTKTLATISSAVNLKVADSGDSAYDTVLLVVPNSCFEGEVESLLCGDGVVGPGEECDDGNKESGDGCSSTCQIEDSSQDCWWVQGNSTPVTLDCNDQQPHPVNQETVCYRVGFDDPQQPNLTQKYCNEFGGQKHGNWCCADVGDNPYEMVFTEDSVHELEYYCKDSLGNEEETTDIEQFRVDSVPPNTTKKYLGAFYEENGTEYIDTNSSVMFNANDGGEICHVDELSTHYRFMQMEDSACENPGEYCTPPENAGPEIIGHLEWSEKDDQPYWKPEDGSVQAPANISAEAAKGFGEHRTYEFAVPLSELDVQLGDTVNLGVYTLDGKHKAIHRIANHKPSTMQPGFPWTDASGWPSYVLTNDGTPITVDGDLNDWSAASYQYSESDALKQTTSGDIPVTREFDFYATVYNKTLYVGIDYKNDTTNDAPDGNTDGAKVTFAVPEWQEYAEPVGIPDESCHLIQYYSEDALGNVEEKKHQCVFVDKTPPQIEKNYSGEQFLGTVHKKLKPFSMGKKGWGGEMFDFTKNWQCGEQDYFNWSPVEVEKYYTDKHLEFMIEVPGGLKDGENMWFEVDADNNGTADWQFSYHSDVSAHYPQSHWSFRKKDDGWSQHMQLPSWIKATKVNDTTFSVEVVLDKLGNDNGMMDDYGTKYSFAGFVVKGDEGFPQGTCDPGHDWTGEAVIIPVQPETGYFIQEMVPMPKWISPSTNVSLMAKDMMPHPSGLADFEYRVTLVDDSNCWNSCNATGSGSWTDYGESFTIDEESCHMIEAKATDNVGKTGVHKQCVFVDNTPPTPNKTVSEPKTKWDGADANFYNISDRCWSDGEGSIECWEVTMNTPISMECSDEGPHPVDHENVCFSTELDGKDMTENYCEYYDGNMNEEGYCCVGTELPGFKFHEESEHNLKYYCEDALGNRGPTDDEKFKVKGTKFEIPLEMKWNLISVPFVLLNDDPEEVFKDIENLDSVWAYDSVNGTWKVWSPNGPSSLEHIKPGWGYWVLMEDGPETLTLGGSLMDPSEVPPERNLVPGWNLVGYYGTNWQQYDGGNMFGNPAYCSLYSLIDSTIGHPRWSSLWGYENDGVNSEWKPLQKQSTMYAGKGYWVELDVGEKYVPSTACPMQPGPVPGPWSGG